MKKELIKEIVEVLNKNFKGKTVNVIFNGSIETVVKIKDFRYYITRYTTTLSSGRQERLKLDNYWIDDIVVKENSVKFFMDSDFSITIDC